MREIANRYDYPHGHGDDSPILRPAPVENGGMAAHDLRNVNLPGAAEEVEGNALKVKAADIYNISTLPCGCVRLYLTQI